MLIFDFGALIVFPILVLLFSHNMYLGILSFLFVAVFMYSPNKVRNFKYNKDIFYSPAAGYVRKITQDHDKLHMSLFLNVFDNHTQYFPVKSDYISNKRVSGAFVAAYNEHSINNERVIHTLRSIDYNFEYTITQITGLLTRRIFVLAKPGEKYAPGLRLGHIVFGSRVDIVIPLKHVSKLLIKEGQHISELQDIIYLKSM